MKKKNIILIAVVAVVALWAVSTYNGLVKSQQSVESQWGNVENAYQRRADLIPNLVETVKGYAKHENETFKEVVEARSKATQTTVDASDLTAEQLEKFQVAQGEIGTALSHLIAIGENYPELKANENFKELQAQLEGTENRIKEERDLFNKEAKGYNVKIKTFPSNLIAGIFGFESKPYFKSAEGAAQAPTVSF